MGKYIFITFLLAVFCMSCGSGTTRIDGTVKEIDLDGKTVYLYTTDDMYGEKRVKVDSTIIKDSKFSLEGSADYKVYTLKLADGDYPASPILKEPGQIDVVWGVYMAGEQATGTPINDARQVYVDERRKITESAVNDLLNLAEVSNPAFVRDSIHALLNEQASRYIKQNAQNGFGEYEFYDQIGRGMEPKVLSELLDYFPKEVKEKEMFKEVERWIKSTTN